MARAMLRNLRKASEVKHALKRLQGGGDKLGGSTDLRSVRQATKITSKASTMRICLEKRVFGKSHCCWRCSYLLYFKETAGASKISVQSITATEISYIVLDLLLIVTVKKGGQKGNKKPWETHRSAV